MSATDFDHIVELGRFRRKGVDQSFERRDETLLELLGRADVNCGWNHVVARLTHVDVIVRVNWLAGADRFAGELAGAIGDDFVRVRVRARAGTGLENVEWKMVVEFSFRNLLGRLHDERAPFRIEQTKIVIGLCGSPLQQAERTDKRARETPPANRKIKHGPLGRGAVKSGFRDGHLAHGILFGSGLAGAHAVREIEILDVAGAVRTWPFRV